MGIIGNSNADKRKDKESEARKHASITPTYVQTTNPLYAPREENTKK